MKDKRPRDEIKVISELDQLATGLEHGDPGAEEEARERMQTWAHISSLALLTELFRAIADWFARDK